MYNLWFFTSPVYRGLTSLTTIRFSQTEVSGTRKKKLTDWKTYLVQGLRDITGGRA